MSTKEVTQQDVINYIEKKYVRGSTYYTQREGKLHITQWLTFNTYPHSTLPCGIVFEEHCDFDSCTRLESFPDDIVLKCGLHLNFTKISTLPALNIGSRLDISSTDIVLQDGIYIDGTIYSEHTLYEYLHNLEINGYISRTGVLS